MALLYLYLHYRLHFRSSFRKTLLGGAGEKIDLWKDGFGNLFYRTGKRSNYEPLHENIRHILNKV
jgi:hypothetical protein